MDSLFILMTAFSSFILIFGLISKFLTDYLFLSEPIVSVLFGILIGHHGLNVNILVESNILFYRFTQIVLAVQVMTTTMSLPPKYSLKNYQDILIILFPIALFKFFISFLILYLILNMNIFHSLLIAGCLTPTDPILSSSIIKSNFAKKNISYRLRNILSVESAINDGIGLIFIFIPYYLFTESGIFTSGRKIFLMIFYEVLFSALVGIIIGYVSRKILKFAHQNELIGTESFLIYGLSLSFFSLGFMELIGGSELICVFFTGTVFSWDSWFVLETRESKLQEVVDYLFSNILFVLFGSRYNFFTFDVKNACLILLLIVVGRLPIFLALSHKLKNIKGKEDAFFVGWFGPVGVGALYYSTLLDMKLKTDISQFTSLFVLVSTIIYGLSISVFQLIRLSSNLFELKGDEIFYESYKNFSFEQI